MRRLDERRRTMDHPFFYAVQDDKTGELLFIGVLMNPSP
jgi:serine protease inhibitor